MTKIDLIHAYRHLYRAGLKAVCYSYPARNSVRTLLRRAFRVKDAHFDERAIKRTIWFLNNAAREFGIEHKVVRNILMVHYWRDFMARRERPSWRGILNLPPPKKTSVVTDTTYIHYEKTIDMLNKSMGLCLPLR